MAGQKPEFINRRAIDTDQATNRSAIVTLGAGIAAAIAGVNTHQPIWEWGPIAAMALTSAFSQYLQAGPSKNMRMVQRLLDIEGDSNADIITNLVGNLAGDRGGDRVGRDDLVSRQSNRGLNASDVRDRPHRPTVDLGGVSVPEWSTDNRPAAYREADKLRGRQPIEGTDLYPSEFAAMSRSATESEDGPRSEAW